MHILLLSALESVVYTYILNSQGHLWREVYVTLIDPSVVIKMKLQKYQQQAFGFNIEVSKTAFRDAVTIFGMATHVAL